MLASSKLRSKPSKLSGLLNSLQLRGVRLTLSNDGFLLIYDQRTGKTLIALRVIEKAEPANVLLVVPKTNIVSTWVKHIEEYLPQYLIFRTWEAYKLSKEPFKILLIHYESLPAIYKKLRKHRWALIVYDEAQRLKQRSSRNARLAKGLVQCADNRLGLTGTPLDQSPIELFSIMRFIEPSALGSTWKEFETEYLEPIEFDWRKAKGRMRKRQLMIAAQKKRKNPKFKYGKLEQLYERVGPYVLRVTQEDMGIMPPIVHRTPVAMVGPQQEMYDKLELDMLVQVGDTVIIAPLKVTQIVKCQQMTGGFIYDELKDVHPVGKAKLRKLKSLLNRIDPPVVIFCKFVPEIEMIEKMLKEWSPKVAVLHGKIKDKKNDPRRTQLLLDFQKGKYDYLVCQQRTGGVGIDLYHSRKAIVYSMGHSGIDYRQMMARLTHLYQDEPPEWWLLYVPDTIDEDILVSQDQKRSVFDVTMDRLRSYYG